MRAKGQGETANKTSKPTYTRPEILPLCLCKLLRAKAQSQISFSTNRKMCVVLFIKLSEDLNNMDNSTLQYFGRVNLLFAPSNLSDLQNHQLVRNIKVKKFTGSTFLSLFK